SMVTLPHRFPRTLEGIILFSAVQVEIADRRRGIFASKDRINDDSERCNKIDLIGTIPARGAESAGKLSSVRYYLHVDRITRSTLAIEAGYWIAPKLLRCGCRRPAPFPGERPYPSHRTDH